MQDNGSAAVAGLACLRLEADNEEPWVTLSVGDARGSNYLLCVGPAAAGSRLRGEGSLVLLQKRVDAVRFLMGQIDAGFLALTNSGKVAGSSFYNKCFWAYDPTKVEVCIQIVVIWARVGCVVGRSSVSSVLIVGHSFVRWPGKHAHSRHFGRQLGLDGAQVMV
ncbi:hypothetical protein NDU88_008510 [Pleurodeles waltl]|uniref:Uncharacterized protein n=1 Tax=Pleurodeles waltl TaxID=8319 RepID=A0AAV7QUU8_PLEWA|nr:hypothetical protein NDU88_008510 [Pleurodeles waltl]